MEEMSALSAPRPYGIEVRGIAVEFEYHITGVIAYCAGGVAGAVVEKLVACAFGGGGSSCLSGGEFTEGGEEGGVNSMEAFNFVRGQSDCSIDGVGELDLDPVLFCDGGIRTILGLLGCWVLEFV